MPTPDLAVLREQYAQDLEAALERIRASLAARDEVERVILIGSYAAGRRDLWTDLDLVVVMRSPLGIAERTAALYRDLDAGVDLDLLVYTPEEFERMRERPFLRRALAGGRTIHEKSAP